LTFQKLTNVSGAALRTFGLGLALLFHWAWLRQPLGWPLAAFHLALVALALVRPKDALLVLAGLGPLTTTLAMQLHSPRAGTFLLVAMLWAVATGLLVRRTESASGTRLGVPALLLATVVLASATVAIAGHPVFITGYAGLRDAAFSLIAGELFEWVWPWIPLHLAVIMSLALFMAVNVEQAVRVDRQFATRLIMMLLVGHAAAVAVGLSRFASAAVRDGEIVAAGLRLMAGVRYHSQYDVNAAGSTLVIVACAGIGLVTAAHHRVVTWIGVLVVLAGIWMAGSRAALVALIAVLVLKPLLNVISAGGRRAWLSGGATVVVVAVAAAGLYAFYPVGRNVPTSVAYESRAIMLRTAWRAGLSDPVFGIGIGRLPERGHEFGSDGMRELMGVAGTRENAHNQYLQVFAELGLVGIVAFALLIGNIGWLSGLRPGGDPLLSWTTWGLLASLSTWLLGHPLLVAEAAVVFWLFVGLIAGLNPPPAIQTGERRLARGLGILLAAVVLIMTPVRASKAARLAALEHQGIGVSAAWRHEGDLAYRTAGATFTLFLPSSTAVVVPLRLAHPSPNLVIVEVFLRGVMVDRREISFDAWRRVILRVPESNREFERVEFAVRGAAIGSADQDVVHIGKATASR
jgi:hypothetical protein